MNNEKAHKILLQVTQVLVLFSFLMPLVVLPSSFIFPFIVPRVLFFRIVITLATACYLLLLFVDFKRYRPKFDLITGAVLIFFLSWIVSTILSVDKHKSIWDNHERMLGLYTMAHYGLMYFIAQNVFKTWKEWRMVWLTFLALSIPAFLVGFIQIFDKPFFLNRDATRVAATLGNPIYVSAYSIFLFFLAMYMYIKEHGSQVWQWFVFIVGLLALVNFGASNTRGTSLGLMAGAVVSVFAFAFFVKGASRNLRVGLIAIIALGVLFLAVLLPFRDTNFVYKIPVVGRIVTLKVKGSTAETRLIAWDIAIKAWKEKVMFGWGPVNYYYAFNQYYNPRSLLHGAEETWFDNAHSMIFNTLTERGLFGLFSYLFLFLAPLIVIFKIRRGKGGTSVFLFGLIFLTTHFVHNVFVFDNITSYLYFFLFLAFVSAYTRFSVPATQENAQIKRKPNLFLIAVLGFVAVYIIFIWNMQVAFANQGSFRSIQQFKSVEDGLISFKQTLNIKTPHIDDVRNDFARVFLIAASQIIPSLKNSEEAGVLRDALLFVRGELEKTLIELKSRDIRIHMEIANIDHMLTTITKDRQYLEHAESILKSALELSPRRQQIFLDLARILMIAGEEERAVATLEQAVQLEPTAVQVLNMWARGAFQAGQKDKAAEAQFKALEVGYMPPPGSDRRNVARIIAGSSQNVDVLAERLEKIKLTQDVSYNIVYDELISFVRTLREEVAKQALEAASATTTKRTKAKIKSG